MSGSVIQSPACIRDRRYGTERDAIETERWRARGKFGVGEKDREQAHVFRGC
jgi:hypothetical protein